MSKHLLPLIPAGLAVVQGLPAPDHVTILTTPQPATAICPDCGMSSHRIHSRYERALGDLPWQGLPVTLRVQARRCRCLVLAAPDLLRAPGGRRGGRGTPDRTAGRPAAPSRPRTWRGGGGASGRAPGYVHQPRHTAAHGQDRRAAHGQDRRRWRRPAAGTLLAEFAANMRRDLDAVQAALDTPWTTSPAEGQINRKAITRSMYGRAGFQLLRARVLSAA